MSFEEFIEYLYNNPYSYLSRRYLRDADNPMELYDKMSKPFLRILEEPQILYRYRYVSEVSVTHPCLLGRSYGTNRSRAYPTVELVNYNGEARIKCELAQHDSPENHPHKLTIGDEDNDVIILVPEHGSYKVTFAGITIIHTPRKNVPTFLRNKFVANNWFPNVDKREIQMKCEEMARSMNLNIVRLKFSAHDVRTGKEICEPVFSELIHNMPCFERHL